MVVPLLVLVRMPVGSTRHGMPRPALVNRSIDGRDDLSIKVTMSLSRHSTLHNQSRSFRLTPNGVGHSPSAGSVKTAERRTRPSYVRSQ